MRGAALLRRLFSARHRRGPWDHRGFGEAAPPPRQHRVGAVAGRGRRTMNEERIRDALRSQASPRTARDDGGRDVVYRARKLHRRRRFAQASIAAVTAIALVFGGLAVTRTLDDRTSDPVVA